MFAVNYYSRWIKVVKLINTTSGTVTVKLKWTFVRCEFPNMRTDNGPYKDKGITQLIKEWNIWYITSNPHHPENNGLEEKSVQSKTIKRV